MRKKGIKTAPPPFNKFISVNNILCHNWRKHFDWEEETRIDWNEKPSNSRKTYEIGLFLQEITKRYILIISKKIESSLCFYVKKKCWDIRLGGGVENSTSIRILNPSNTTQSGSAQNWKTKLESTHIFFSDSKHCTTSIRILIYSGPDAQQGGGSLNCVAPRSLRP